MGQNVVIKNLYWDKAYFVIQYESDKPEKWFISKVDEEGRDLGRVEEVADLNDGEMTPVKKAGVFVCQAGDSAKMLPEGTWKLNLEGGEYSFAPEVMMNIRNLSHAFMYTGKKRAYVVDPFFMDDNVGALYLDTSFMMENRNPTKRDASKNIIKWCSDRAYGFYRLFKPRGKKGILFLSETREVMSDNFKAVYEGVKKRQLDQKYTVEVILKNEMDNRVSKLSKLNILKRIAMNDIIFVDDYVPIFTVIDLDPQVKLVQLWHAGFGYKLVGYGRFGRTGTPHVYQSCHRKYTHAVIGNEALKETYREVFGIPKERLMATGMPRLDDFLNEDTIKDAKDYFYKEYPILNGKRVILFAPTYRGMSQQDAIYDYSQINLDDLYKICNDTNSVVVFKWHHFIKDRINIPEEYKDRLMDLTEENINSLMYVSDVLVTDYSSCFYDYVLLQRPIVFYVYDEAEYTATRGVHKPVAESAPGIICHSFDELKATLSKTDIPRVEPKPYMIDNCLTNGDKTATDRILDEIFGEEK